MHVGSITESSITAAARVYRTLCAAHGGWIGGWELQDAAKTTAVSTRVSEVRLSFHPASELRCGKWGISSSTASSSLGRQSLPAKWSCSDG